MRIREGYVTNGLYCILKFPSKLLITNSFNGQQMVAVEIISRKLNNFLKVPYAS